MKTEYHLLGHILSNTNNEEKLKNIFTSEQVNWDEFVKVASSELMLPASFLSLKRKDLLRYLPEDLNEYLEEITKINRNRNAILLSETQEITNLLSENNINHVFIKGIAIIASNLIEDIGFRMIGDIDILIDRNQIDRAFKLLKTQGYNDLRPFNYEVKDYRHYPRQISKNKYGAIELHEFLLNLKTNYLLNPAYILKNKIYLQGIPIPNKQDSIKIAAYTTQINDKYQKIPNVKFKSTYDTLILGLDPNQEVYKTIKSNAFGKLFIELSSIYFQTLKNSDKPKNRSFKYIIFKHLSKRKGIKRSFIRSLSRYYTVTERLQLFVSNPSYRKHVLRNKILNLKE
ncbi:nucleotidyltransferase family protein [Mangrovimonas sp. ST2L15]|uniref:nucleotidyltransferase family protein n=1 Tax=Mangrovimonas sp. ST2L15 TaxID=1645916 RepID=UPI0006B69700|nr:nucleotidyltransferase family protein [Mangrovimonas sp. ST2L15]